MARAGRRLYGTNVWATILDATPPAVTAPGRRLEQLVPQREPRPVLRLRDPGGGRSAQPVVAFDNPVAVASASDAQKLTFKNDNQGIVNLTPASSYKCETVGGELSWDYPSKVLHHPGHDLHRRKREDRHRRHRPLQGAGDDLHLGITADQEHERVRL